MLMIYVVLFFFVKQKTAYEMRISDWSSDVCSSDLLSAGLPSRSADRDGPAGAGWRRRAWHPSHRRAGPEPGLQGCGCTDGSACGRRAAGAGPWRSATAGALSALAGAGHDDEIGRAACRESVCQYV